MRCWNFPFPFFLGRMSSTWCWILNRFSGGWMCFWEFSKSESFWWEELGSCKITTVLLHGSLRRIPQTMSRSPVYKRRQSPSSVSRKHSRSSRQDRSRSPYASTCSRHKSRTPSHRWHRRRSASPRPRRHEKKKSRSISRSLTRKSQSPQPGSSELKQALERDHQEEEEKKRRQQEAELKLLEEETRRRIEAAIQKRVEEVLNSMEVKVEIQRSIEDGRKKMFEDIVVQLAKEKEENLSEARKKEEQAWEEREEFDRILKQNQQEIEEAQRKAAMEQQHEEEERYRELEALQLQKEEAMRQKKLEEEQERAEQMKLLGKNKARPKLSFALGSK